MSIKGVIVAAGYGSRFLPVTKTVPKEMLPLIDRPAIDFIVGEMIEAGIRDILIITSRRKKTLEDYFDREVELEGVFTREGKADKLARIRPPEANILFARQQEMLGTGHALLPAEPFTGDHPFVVAYPDDIVLAETPLSAQLIAAHRQTGGQVLAVKDLGDADVSRYGVVEPAGPGNPCKVARLVEKPPAGAEPSKLVSYGRYLFLPTLFDELRRDLEDHEGGELYHVDAINRMAAAGTVHALDFEGERLDTGEPMGYLEACCRYALTRPDMADSARDLFRRLDET